jgi:hypothetical protein
LCNVIIIRHLEKDAISILFQKVNLGVPRACLGVSVRDGSQSAILDFQAPKLASFYETFAPADARRLAERLKIHYTPH